MLQNRISSTAQLLCLWQSRHSSCAQLRPARLYGLAGGTVLKTKTDSGLEYEDIKLGEGASPQTGQVVVVHYVGTLTNGSKFDSSRDRGRPFEFIIGVGQVIKGWDEGVASMKVGGTRNLTIPADLGYGKSGVGPIPPNATLLFEVELLAIR